MPIIPKDPPPLFGSNNFNSIQGVTITGAFEKLFARDAQILLNKAACEHIFNNEEATL